MDILSILHQSWQITWRRWQLWLLSLAMLFLSIPVFALSFTYGFSHGLVGAFRANPQFWADQNIVPSAVIAHLENLPPFAWLSLGLAATLLVIVFMPAAVFVQGAMARIVIFAYQQQPSGLRPAFAFDRRQVRRILLLGVLTGLLNGVLVVLPVALAELLPAGSRDISTSAQAILSPIGVLAGLALIILLIAVVVEDLLPPGPPRRMRDVFRTGWWAFLLVSVISSLLGAAVVLFIALPLVPLVAVSIFTGSWLVTLPCMGPLGLVALFLWVFAAVFTLALNTLVYRSAAQAAG